MGIVGEPLGGEVFFLPRGIDEADKVTDAVAKFT
jgi:hypothetical protein